MQQFQRYGTKYLAVSKNAKRVTPWISDSQPATNTNLVVMPEYGVTLLKNMLEKQIRHFFLWIQGSSISYNTGDTVIELQLLVLIFLTSDNTSECTNQLEYTYKTCVLAVIKRDRDYICGVDALCCFSTNVRAVEMSQFIRICHNPITQPGGATYQATC